MERLQQNRRYGCVPLRRREGVVLLEPFHGMVGTVALSPNTASCDQKGCVTLEIDYPVINTPYYLRLVGLDYQAQLPAYRAGLQNLSR
jgi:hypothetical protein